MCIQLNRLSTTTTKKQEIEVINSPSSGKGKEKEEERPTEAGDIKPSPLALESAKIKLDDYNATNSWLNIRKLSMRPRKTVLWWKHFGSNWILNQN
jgi:hypothetical protein